MIPPWVKIKGAPNPQWDKRLRVRHADGHSFSVADMSALALGTADEVVGKMTGNPGKVERGQELRVSFTRTKLCRCNAPNFHP